MSEPYVLNFGESVLNSGRIILLFGLPDPFHNHCVATSGAVISGRFVGPVIPDNHVKFGDHRLNLSGEIPPEAV